MSTTKSIQNGVKDSYDAMAEEYTEWVESKNFHPARIRYVEKMLSLLQNQSFTTDNGATSKARILELGCGAGVPVTKYLAHREKIGYVVGNDVSEKQIELARKRVPAGDGKVEFVAGDMLELDFSKESLDGVVAFFSLFHLPVAGQTSMLKKVFEWVKPGGVLVCNFGATASQTTASGDEQGKDWGCFFNTPMYFANLGTHGSVEMIRGSGFEVLECEVLDATDCKGGLEIGEVDAGVEFVWVVPRRP